MAIHPLGRFANGPARANGKLYVAYGTEIGRVKIDADITVLQFYIVDPALRHSSKKDPIVSIFLEVSGICGPWEMNGEMFDPYLLN
jgi:hypothetical protein